MQKTVLILPVLPGHRLIVFVFANSCSILRWSVRPLTSRTAWAVLIALSGFSRFLSSHWWLSMSTATSKLEDPTRKLWNIVKAACTCTLKCSNFIGMHLAKNRTWKQLNHDMTPTQYNPTISNLQFWRESTFPLWRMPPSSQLPALPYSSVPQGSSQIARWLNLANVCKHMQTIANSCKLYPRILTLHVSWLLIIVSFDQHISWHCMFATVCDLQLQTNASKMRSHQIACRHL